jgi:hypothetical protein
MRLKIALVGLVSGLAVTGCEQDKICAPNVSDRELLAQYAGRSLQEVYDRHLELVSRCTPPRSTLASRLADFGPAAKTYALSKLQQGDSRSFIAASSVIGTVNAVGKVTCSEVEFAKLSQAARRLEVGKAKPIYVASVLDACGLKKNSR